MKIEEPGKKPNFALIVALAGAALLVFFVIALIVLHSDHHLEPKATPAPTTHAAVRAAPGYDVA